MELKGEGDSVCEEPVRGLEDRGTQHTRVTSHLSITISITNVQDVSRKISMN